MRTSTATIFGPASLTLAVTASVAALVDCASLGDLSNGNTDAASADANAEGAVADAGSDTTLPLDAGATPEAAADVAPDGLCAQSGSFCDDFDQGPLGARWTNMVQSAGEFTLTDASATSPPLALRVTLFEPSSGADAAPASVNLRKSFLGAPKTFTCDVNVFVDETPIADVTVFFLNILHGTSSFSVGFDVEPAIGGFWAAGTLPDGGRSFMGKTLPPLPARTWVRVTLATDFATATVSLNGAAAGTFALPTLPRVGYEVFLSGDSNPPPGAASILFDDLVCVTSN